VNHIKQIDLVVDDRYFKFADDPDDRPTVGVNVGILYPTTSIGGTCRRVDSGDRHTWNSKVCVRTQDIRFIQVRVARVAYPMSCLE
jgi:anaerobic selenocysteine-containing dehydrogenase